MTEKSCFNCGKETTREARLDDNLQIDAKLPFRPVCNECGPQWEISEILPCEAMMEDWQVYLDGLTLNDIVQGQMVDEDSVLSEIAGLVDERFKDEG